MRPSTPIPCRTSGDRQIPQAEQVGGKRIRARRRSLANGYRDRRRCCECG